jgi:hypothetical protein
MRAVIVKGDELPKEVLELGVVVPGLSLEPLFEGKDKAFGDAIGSGMVRGDADVKELLVASELLEELGDEVGAIIGDEELEVRGQEGTEGIDNHLGGDVRASEKEGETETVAGAIIDNDENGKPEGRGHGEFGEGGQLRQEGLAGLPPLSIFLLALRLLLLALLAEFLPGLLLLPALAAGRGRVQAALAATLRFVRLPLGILLATLLALPAAADA